MKHTLITGGTDGLGKVLARKLMADGFAVTILGRDAAKSAQVAQELGCKYVVADVSDAAQVAAAVRLAVEQGGDIDVLVNNAAVWIQDALELNDDAAIDQAFAANSVGPVHTTKAVVSAMKRRGSGRIINVISQAGLYGKAERAVYNASKWAVTGFTKSMQAELRPHHIAVTGFYPGALQNDNFFKGKDARNMSKGLELETTADAIAYICKLPDHVEVPEFGIGSMNY